jgi:ribosomal protein S18 acetylase RimI-like enzyme
MQTISQCAATSYRLQRAGAEHDALLLRLYVCQREQEVRALGWDAEQCRLFLALQWRARNASYAARYPDAVDQIVMSSDLPVGRILTAETPRALHLVDVALLPECRKHGLGSQLLRDLQRACARKAQTIVLYVACDNPARRLYARLGFVVVGEDQMYMRMEW